MTIKGDVNRKWTSTENFRTSYDKIFKKREKKMKKAEALEQLALLTEQAITMRRIIKDTLWMAQRYADGRSSYSTHMFNQAVDQAMYLGIIEGDQVKYATDGMFGTWNPITGGWNHATTYISQPIHATSDTHGDDDEGCVE